MQNYNIIEACFYYNNNQNETNASLYSWSWVGDEGVAT